MGNVDYIVIKSHNASYPDPIVFSKGEKIKKSNRESEWEGWVWCTAEDGRSGWVPERLLSDLGENAISLRGFSARELSVEEGQKLQMMEVESGWGWCRNESGETGWVPLRCLRAYSG